MTCRRDCKWCYHVFPPYSCLYRLLDLLNKLASGVEPLDMSRMHIVLHRHILEAFNNVCHYLTIQFHCIFRVDDEFQNNRWTYKAHWRSYRSCRQCGLRSSSLKLSIKEDTKISHYCDRFEPFDDAIID